MKGHQTVTEHRIFAITDGDLADLYDGQQGSGAWDGLPDEKRSRLLETVKSSLNDYLWDSVGACLQKACELEGESWSNTRSK